MSFHDLWAEADEARNEYRKELIATPEASAYDGIVLAVAHGALRAVGLTALRSYGRDNSVFCDQKSVFARNDSDLTL